MLDIAPHIEQAIMAQAEQQGVTVNQYLSNMVYQEPYLDTDIMTFSFKPTPEQAKQIQEWLDNPPQLSAEAKAFLMGE